VPRLPPRGFNFDSCLEYGRYLCFHRISGVLSFTVCIGIYENEEIAKIAPVIFNDPFCLRLTTIVIGSCCMKDTIEAAAQVRSAKGTGFPTTHRDLDFQTL